MVENMKPSDIAWIGDIPESWNVKRVKYLASLKGRIGWQGLTSDEYMDYGPYLITGIDFKNGNVDLDSCVHISKERWEEAREIQIKNGDLLITKDGTVGKVAIVSDLDNLASLNSGVLVIRTQPDFDRRFLYWVLLSEEFWTWFRLKNSGNSTIIHLYQNDFAEFTYAFPNLHQQTLIANFLDEQCGKIDSIIVDIEKQIDILREYKKSLITETVTKGIDKTVSMKESGIEWIGEIPEHWQVKRIKDVSNMQTGTTPPANEGINYDDEGVFWFTPSDFNDGSIKLDKAEKCISNEAISSNAIKIYPKESVLFVGIASVGKIGFSSSISYSNQQITAIKPTEKNIGKYLAYSVLASIEYIKSNALYTTVPIVNNAYLGTIKICLPNYNEQIQIANYLDKLCAKIETIVESKKEQLTKITEHKKSLIYEYVTGKKRVKGVIINGN